MMEDKLEHLRNNFKAQGIKLVEVDKGMDVLSAKFEGFSANFERLEHSIHDLARDVKILSEKVNQHVGGSLMRNKMWGFFLTVIAILVAASLHQTLFKLMGAAWA